jgi:hypothetical protein
MYAAKLYVVPRSIPRIVSAGGEARFGKIVREPNDIDCPLLKVVDLYEIVSIAA